MPICNMLLTTTLQIREFLQFFDVKRDLYVSEVGALFEDAKEARYAALVLLTLYLRDILLILIKAIRRRVF